MSRESRKEQEGPHRGTYLPGYGAVSHHEVRTAESCATYLLPTLKQMAATNPSLTLLDIGAGSGTITASLAKYMPQGRITATDLADEIIAKATQHAIDVGVNNVRFQQGNVYELPFPDNDFDIVHSHQMLLYLEDPVRGLREMLRVTRPGGVVAVRNNDLTMWSWWPRTPGLSRFHEIQMATHEATGGTTMGGIQLISWALKAGLSRDQLTPSQGVWSYSEPLERQTWASSFAQRARTGPLGKKALEMNLATQAELEEMAEAWEEWAVAEDGWFACLHGEILIHK